MQQRATTKDASSSMSFCEPGDKRLSSVRRKLLLLDVDRKLDVALLRKLGLWSCLPCFIVTGGNNASLSFSKMESSELLLDHRLSPESEDVVRRIERTLPDFCRRSLPLCPELVRRGSNGGTALPSPDTDADR